MNLSVTRFDYESCDAMLPPGFVKRNDFMEAEFQIIQHLLPCIQLYIARLRESFLDAKNYTVTVNA